MNICVFDTETTSLEKPFCYNIGYLVIDTDTSTTLARRSYIVEQVWHNLPLFETAYYANKRPLYVSAMKSRRCIMDKFGYICQQMIRDFKAFEVENAFAYNSAFDEKVFRFNCDWFKCINPFDNIPVKDIRGFVHHFLIDDDYKDFCEQHEYFTDTGNYSTTAETVFRYLVKNPNFIEEHTALMDAEIEYDILWSCILKGADLNDDYKAFKSIDRPTNKTLHIKTVEQTDYYFDYTKIRINKAKTEITLK